MSDVVHHVDFKLAAKDETASAFKSAGARLREFQREQRAAGEPLIEKTLKGAGVVGLATFGIETLGGLAKAAQEAAQGTHSAGEAWGQFLEKGIGTVPVLGKWVEGVNAIGDAVNGLAAHQALAKGATVDEAEGYMSASKVKEHYIELLKEQAKTTAELTKIMNAERLVGLKGVDKSVEAERQKFEEEKAKLVQEVVEFRSSRGNMLTSGDQAEIDHKNAAILELQRKHAKDEEEIRREAHRLIEQEEDDHQKRLRDLVAGGEQSRLKEAGLTLEAEKHDIQTKLADQISARDRALEEAKKDVPDIRKAQLNAERDEEVREMRKQAADATAQAQDREDQRLERGEFDHQQELNRIRADASADYLRSIHQDAEAAIAELRARHRAELDETKQHLNELGAVVFSAGVTDAARAVAARAFKEAQELSDAQNATFDAKMAELRKGQQERDEATVRKAFVRAMHMEEGGSTGALAPGGELGNRQIGLAAAAQAQAAGARAEHQRQMLKNAEDTVENLKALRTVMDAFGTIMPDFQKFILDQVSGAANAATGGDLIPDSNFM